MDEPAADPSLYDLVDDAYRLVGQYRNGYIRGRPESERRAWLQDLLNCAERLGDELRTRLPPEHGIKQQQRIAARNRRMRRDQPG